MDKYLSGGILALFMILTFRDLLLGAYKGPGDHEQSDGGEYEDLSEAQYSSKPLLRQKEIPVTGFNRKSTLTINTVNILYWYVTAKHANYQAKC